MTPAPYLDLLARTLTNQIYGDPPIDPWSPPQFSRYRRERGLDWPSQAMTMIGDQRMANLRMAVETVIAENIPGDLIECGIWRGGACIYMAGILAAYGVMDRHVYVADSFAGLPAPKCAQDAGDTHHIHPQLSVSVETVKRNFRKFDLLTPAVRFLPGWFSDTLASSGIERLAVLRLDGDMYASTMDALVPLYPRVSPGGFVIVDDYHEVPGCKQAITDYRAEHGIVTEIREIDGLGVYWRIE